MKAPPDADPDICATLNRHGLRITALKVHLLTLLSADHGSRMSVDTLYNTLKAQGIRTSLGSVYRSVRDMLQHGLLHQLWNGGEKALYSRLPDHARHTTRPPALHVTFRHAQHETLLTVIDPQLYAHLHQTAQSCGLTLDECTIIIQALSPAP